MTTALTTTTGGSGELDSLKALGNALAASRYFKEACDPAKAVVKILYGKELGLGPVQSLLGIDFNEKGGSLSLRAHTMAALIRRSGRYDYRVTKGPDDEGCEITFYEVAWEKVGDLTKREIKPIGTTFFGPKDAKRAGLASKSTYLQHTYDMYYNRAMAKGARMHCPDVFGAPVYIEEEVENFVGGKTPSTKSAPAAAEEKPPIQAKATVLADPPEVIDAIERDGRVTAEQLGAKPETLPESLKPDAPVDAKATVISEEEIIMGDVIPVDMARRIYSADHGSVLSSDDANDFHGFLVDHFGGGAEGQKAAKAAWKEVGVTLAKGAQVTREQAVAVAVYANSHNPNL